MKKLITVILATCMLMGLVACGEKAETSNEEVQNESATVGGQQQTEVKGKDFIGVFRGEDYTIVFAQDVEPTEDFKGEIKIAIDMGFDIFFPYTAKIVSDTEITDFTYRGEEVVADFGFKLDGDTLYYHRSVPDRDIEDNITLQRTDEDVTEVYNEILQKSSEHVAQSAETEVTEKQSAEVTEPVPDANTQPDEMVPIDDTSTEVEKYPFVGITYKNEDLALTFKMQTPDKNGYTKEILLNGVTYSDVTFDNDTYALSNVSITKEPGTGFGVIANWYVDGQEYEINIQESGDNSWKMFAPGICSGYYYPE